MKKRAGTVRTLGLTLSSVLLATLWAACAGAPEEASVDGEPDVTAASRDDAPSEEAARAFAEAWDSVIEQGDAAAVAALFTADAAHLVADAPLTLGRGAVEESFTRLFNAFTVDSDNPVDEVVVAGDWAWVRGTFEDTRTSKQTGESTQLAGKWLSILRPTEDGWKYALDSSNRDAPGEPGPALESVTLPDEEGTTRGPAEDVAAIRALVSLWLESTRQQDAAIFANSFTEDGLRMNDDAPTDRGRDGILEGWQAGFVEGTTSEPLLTLDVIDVEGDWAWVRGHWGETLTRADGTIQRSMGKYVDICRRTPDGWKIHVSLWNYDAPPPAIAG